MTSEPRGDSFLSRSPPITRLLVSEGTQVSHDLGLTFTSAGSSHSWWHQALPFHTWGSLALSAAVSGDTGMLLKKALLELACCQNRHTQLGYQPARSKALSGHTEKQGIQTTAQRREQPGGLRAMGLLVPRSKGKRGGSLTVSETWL